MIHGRPYHPESQGQVENLNKRVKKKLGKLLPAKDQQMNKPSYGLIFYPLWLRKLTPHGITPYRMYLFGCLKGVELLNLAIQSTRNFLKRVPMEMTESSEMMMRCLNARRIPDLPILVAMGCASNRLRWSWNPVHSFADRLEIGCSLARTREETRLETLEATERMIATNTRHCFRVSEERIREFSVEEVVIFKDPKLNRTSKD